MTATVIQIGKNIAPPKPVSDFDKISEQVLKGAVQFQSLSTDRITFLLDEYGKALQKSEIRGMEGVPFLSMWLRKTNLEKIVKISFPNPKVLSEFVGAGRKKIKAQPRGLVCHWIAGNVPTLGLFSLFQSMLVGNANILRLPVESIEPTKKLLGVMVKSEASELMETFSIVSFPSADRDLNSKLSLKADARVVWGGAEAVEAITGLPRRPHCEDIVFGPKYSFAVIDKKALESSQLNLLLRRLVNDIIIFDQSGCSSPHVLFFEKGIPPKDLMKKIAEEFKMISKKIPKTAIEISTATRIISKRAEYALSDEKDMICSLGNDWTLLYDTEINLEEPVQSRTLFLKPVDSILDVAQLVTNKVQTVGCEIHDGGKLLEFADAVTARGVARCVPFGQMNFYDNPWDGMLVLSRLVRWCSVTE